MGTFTIGCMIKNHTDRDKVVRIPYLMVDTGSEATWIPRPELERADSTCPKDFVEYAGAIADLKRLGRRVRTKESID